MSFPTLVHTHKDTAQNAVLLSHILDILSLCVERHTYHIRNYIIDKNVLARVLVLMTSSHGHLALGITLLKGCNYDTLTDFSPLLPRPFPSLSLFLLFHLSFFSPPPLPPSSSPNLSLYLCPAALRFCRKIVGLKDEFYNRYVVRNNLFRPIVKAFTANGRRYNLLNSAIIEMFEYIKIVRMLSLVYFPGKVCM